MPKNSIFILVLLLIILVSCDNPREEALLKKEAELNLREQLFKEKEAEYQSLLKMRDSLNLVQNEISKDSLVVKAWPEEILGQWNSKIVCVETNCNDYIIGDTRFDMWEFGQDSTNLYVKVFNKRDLIRVYDGKYVNDEIQLVYSTDSTAFRFVHMNVNLNRSSSNKLHGYRTININGMCTAKFSVELTKITN